MTAVSEERTVWVFKHGMPEPDEIHRVQELDDERSDGSLHLQYIGRPSDSAQETLLPAWWRGGTWIRWEDDKGNSGTSPRVDAP